MIKKLLKKINREVDIEELKLSGVKIGQDVFINNGCIFDRSFRWLIEIGDRVTFAPNVHVICHDASTKRELGYTSVGG